MGIIRFAIDNPVKISVGVILLMLFGVLSIFHIKVQLTPDVDQPVITVRTNWQGASPQEIESQIVERQEEKLKNVSGVQKMTSTSQYGQGTVLLEFPVGTDKDAAFRDVSDKLRQVSDYPDEMDEPTISATVSDMDKTIAWMILYSGEGQDVTKLKTFIEENVKPLLERAEGIAEVSVYGGLSREIQIIVDAHLLAAKGLSFLDLERALRQQNRNISAGTIEQGKRNYAYRTVGEYRSLEDIEETVIAFQLGGPVRVSDVATVVDGFRRPTSFVRSRGRSVLALPARRETGANVINAMSNLRKQIEMVNREILAPRGLDLELTQVYDETTYIWSAIGLVLKNTLYGGILAVMVLLVFLRSSSATGIIAVTIPISIVGTLLVITLLGRSLNVVLLAGMAFAVGLVVDNAIVVLENIYRHRSMGKGRTAAAFDGAREVWGAVFASTLTTMAVFLPIITIQEEAGQLFKDIAIAVSSAVGLSLLVSVIVIPPLAARYFRASKAVIGVEGNSKLGVWVSSIVTRLERSVRSRIAVVLGCTVLAIVGSWALAPATEYLPAGNKNLILGFLFSPPGYSIEEFRRMALIVEEGDPDDPTDGLRPYWEAPLGSPQAAALRPVEIAVGKDGNTKRTVVPSPIDNFFFVSFDGGAFMGATSKEPTNVKPLEYVMNRAGNRVPGVFSMFNQTSLFRTGGLRGGNTIDLEIRSQDLSQVVKAAQAIRHGIQSKGYGHASATPANFDLGRPEVRIVVDRYRAADVGLDVREVGVITEACVDGAFVGEFSQHGDKIDMYMKVKGMQGATMQQVAQVPIRTRGGQIVPLSSVATLIRTTAPQQITHIEEMPSVTLSVKPKLGVPLQETMRELTEDIVAPLRQSGVIPSTVITALAGTASKLKQTQRAMIGDFSGTITQPRFFGASVNLSMAIAVVVVFLIAAAMRMFFGGRTAFRAFVLCGCILCAAFMALNPDFVLMLLQSRAILALLVIYLLLAALFESFVYPFAIMFSVPLAAVGGFASLRLVHEASLYDITTPIQQLDVLTMLGFVILIGIVVNNAILIVHQTLNYMRRDGLEGDAAVALAVQTRTRPIFMSALTSVFGMFPLVVMPGAGSELYRGLGSVVLGGLLVSTVLTLVVVPAMFTLLLDLRRWLGSLGGTNVSDVAIPSTVPSPQVFSSPDA